ncbi:EamA family transporter [Leuconostoc fallax]|uniref:EamA domain-containing protein n=1 Tax=Leuconostoc fallax TaxID=1251 RepID=A0A4R5NAC2_9LACO|nr:DMT family transporter [Leuconostoc fallax]MBU7456442.1 EamA family transporter [Leuconostoc fallax]TDG69446.1 hypothetical protein C5L23_000908 [Leuconostoc fallax]
MKNKALRGVVFGILGAAAYGLNPLFAVPLMNLNFTVDSMVFYRYFFAVILLGCLMLAKRQSFKLQRDEIIPVIAVGLLMALASLFLYGSYEYMDVGLASILLFAYPVIVALIMAIFFKERLSLLTIGAISLVVLGIALLNNSGQKSLNPLGLLIILLASMSYALYIVGVRQTTAHAVPSLKLTFYGLSAGLVLFLIKGMLNHGIQPLTTPLEYGNAIGSAIFPTIIALSLTNLAITHIGSTNTSIVGALEPLTGLFVGVVVFNEIITVQNMVGVMLIILAVTSVVASQYIIAWCQAHLLYRHRHH